MSGADAPPVGPEAATTFPAFVRAVAAAHGERTALALAAEDGGEERISFAGLERASADLARALLARGAGKGSRIGFVYANGPRFAVALAAIARIGAVAVPVSTLARGEELVRVLLQSDVAGLLLQRRILGRDMAERLEAALPGLAGGRRGRLRLAAAPYLRWVATDGAERPGGIETLDALLAEGAGVDEALLQAVEAQVYPSDQMVEIYTSGSMAAPKGVKHDHGPVMMRTHYLRVRMAPEPGAEVAAPMPMFWVGGMMNYLLPNLEAGATSLCRERMALSSRMAMGRVLAAEDLAALPLGRVIWGLGMTETLGPYTLADELRAPGYPLCAPIDHIADGYEARVVDGAGRPVGEGERGEMQVRGYPVTRGVHKLERDALFTADGYYRTGDLCLREGGRLHFIGRDGDLIKTAGANVSPAEVEAELQALPGVHAAYVVGLSDPERGQVVAAGVVPREGAPFDADALRDQLRARLSSYKAPQLIVPLNHAEVPMLFSNKVSRREVRTLIAERLGRPA